MNESPAPTGMANSDRTTRTTIDRQRPMVPPPRTCARLGALSLHRPAPAVAASEVVPDYRSSLPSEKGGAGDPKGCRPPLGARAVEGTLLEVTLPSGRYVPQAATHEETPAVIPLDA